MAKYPVRLATMQQVRDHYDSVKPIRGTNTRPIGCRGRKYEEIRKVDHNTFHFGMLEWGGTFVPYIIWEEDTKGIVTVTIMNGVGRHAHCMVYTFHDYFHPMGMRLVVDGGKQFIQTDRSDKRDYLPKGKSVGYDRKSDDRKPITYSRESPDKPWVLTSKPHLLPRKVVDKERKAQYKQGINDFVEWAWTMVPIIGDQYKSTREPRYDRRRSVGMTAHGGYKFMSLLVDPTSESRLDILCEFISEVHYNAPRHWDRELKCHVGENPITDPKKFREKLNAFINKHGEFTLIVED
jgi:hypothetical protein